MRAAAAEAVDLSENAPDTEGLSSTDVAARRVAVRAELDAVRRPLDRERLVDAVWRATWPHDRLVFGSSRLVRVADEVLGGKKVPVHANRGLAGIDGTIATATGVAVASQAAGAPGVTRVLLGDLAFLHDVGALLFPSDETEPRLQVIVGNDGAARSSTAWRWRAPPPRAPGSCVLHPARCPPGAPRARLRLGVSAGHHAHRSRPGADDAARRSPDHRGAAAAVTGIMCV